MKTKTIQVSHNYQATIERRGELMCIMFKTVAGAIVEVLTYSACLGGEAKPGTLPGSVLRVVRPYTTPATLKTLNQTARLVAQV